MPQSRTLSCLGAMCALLLVSPLTHAQTVRLEAQPVGLEGAEMAYGVLNSMTGPDIVTRDGDGTVTSTTAYRVSHFIVGDAVGLYVERMVQDGNLTYMPVERKALVYADPAHDVPEPEGPGGASILPAVEAPLVRWTSPTSFVYRVWDGREVDPPTYHDYLVEGVDGDTFTVRRAR